jgi:hypothetical protein
LFIYPRDYIKNQFKQLFAGKGKGLMKGSLLHKLFFFDNLGTFIYENKEKSITNINGKSWDKLPKKLWLYWDSGYENTPPETKLFIANMK